MFVWSFRMNKREMIIAAAGIFIFAVLAFILIARGKSGDGAERGGISGADAQAAAAVPASVRGADGCAAYLKSLGWEIDETGVSVREVIIPRRFDREYEEYDALQREQGFDLGALKGERVKLYTYRVLNYPAGMGYASRGDMVANLLIKDGRVVGGDICQDRPGGITQGLDPSKYGGTAAMLQREYSASAIDRTVPDAIPADTDVLPEPDSEGEW